MYRSNTADEKIKIERDQFFAIPMSLCVRILSPHSALMLQSSGIACLDLRLNPHLAKLPAKELCDIRSLKKLECADCPLLEWPPTEVAKNGGVQSIQFHQDCAENGTLNESLALFLIGDGEVGKTSVMRALINEEENTAGKIGKDTRTVGMDVVDWQTKDKEGNTLIFRVKYVGGQKFYMKLQEHFVLDRAVYLYLWQADCEMEEIRNMNEDCLDYYS